MNIFYLDHHPPTCATYHNDKHVIKMIIEYAQLLCGVHHLCGMPDDTLYRLTHQNHPCAVWVRSAKAHYDWLYQLFICLCQEYTHRYDKTHLTFTKLNSRLKDCPFYDDKTFMPPPTVMPKEYQHHDVITSYRHYYRHGKTNLMSYTKRPVPTWLVGEADDTNQPIIT